MGIIQQFRLSLGRADRVRRDLSAISLILSVCMLGTLLAGRSDATEGVLYSFTGGSDGGHPDAGLIVDQSGVLYGTTLFGGGTGCTQNAGCGTAFSLAPPATTGGTWTETLLHSFVGGSDGAAPVAALLAGKSGVLYGTTQSGGPSNAGTVFELTPPATTGAPWTEAIIYSFTGAADGSQPIADLIADKSGTLYGTTEFGGASGSGTVFALTPPATSGGQWTENVLYSFSGGTDGGTPATGLLSGQGGILYGTTETGGIDSCTFAIAPGCGTVFSLTPPASAGGTWTETVLHTFSGRPDGAGPDGDLIAQNGRLVGTTIQGGMRADCEFGQLGCGGGTVFSLTPPGVAGGPWTEKLLYKFKPNSSDGEFPIGALVASTTDVLYGATEGGDDNNGGTVFDLQPPTIAGGSLTEGILHRFHLGNGITDGVTPEAGLVFSNHQLYGTTAGGGAAGEIGDGTVYSVTP